MRARNTHVEATLNHSCAAQVFVALAYGRDDGWRANTWVAQYFANGEDFTIDEASCGDTAWYLHDANASTLLDGLGGSSTTVQDMTALRCGSWFPSFK